MHYHRTLVLATTVALIGLAPAAADAAASKEENIGVGTGAVVGALAGGPVGFIIGAGLGAKIGDKMHQESERVDSLQGSLDDANAAVAELEDDAVEMQVALDRARELARPELLDFMQAGIEMDLLFRTDEALLTDATANRLDTLAQTLASMPDIKVQLDGFADERGDAEYNQGLSERRVEFVRSMFVAAGVHPSRIDALAHGESTAADSSIDSLALERRVSVKLFVTGEPTAVAASPR